MPEAVEIKAGEAKLVTFTILDEDGAAVNTSGSTLTFKVKSGKETGTVVITKEDGTFITHGNGSATVKLSATETNLPKGNYIGELKIQFAADNIDKSDDIAIKIIEAIT